MIAVALLALAPTLAFDVQGSLSDFNLLPDGSIRALVTHPQKPAKGYDKAFVRIGKGTPVVDLRGAEARGLLRDGTIVGVTFMGPVMKSYPAQATAKRVVVLTENFYATGKIADLARTPHGIRFTVLDANNQPHAVATVMPNTKIWRDQNGKRVPSKATDLRNGQRISMGYQGAVALSMPPQGGAGAIVIR